MKAKYLFLLFILVAIIELIGEFTNNLTLIYIAKPLLMITLSAYYFTKIRFHTTRFSTFILVGLLFSIGGDTFLMFKGSHYFILGLGCFLITHLFYIAAFLRLQPLRDGLIAKKSWLLLPFLAYLIGLLYYLRNDLNEMMIPVVVYGSVICMMAITALNTKQRIIPNLFWMMFGGILLFMFSDSVIALNKFKSATLMLPYPQIIIMITYITAQALIAKSTIRINK